MSAADFLPDGRPDLAALGAAAARCRLSRATIHPSAALHAGRERRDRLLDRLVGDLVVMRVALGRP